MSPQNENIVLFPFMAQGHIIPFLSLALKLEQVTGYTITLINTPLNINNLKQILPKSSTIRLLEIPFNPTAHDLPPATETTANLPPPLIRRLVESSTALEPAFKNLISEIRPLCIISDMFFAWTVEIAREFNTLHAVFLTGGGFGMAGWAATRLNPACLMEINSDEFLVPGFPKSYVFKTKNLLETAKGPWKYGEEIFQGWKKTDAMLFNTMEEFDGVGLNFFRQNFSNCSIFAVGPILNYKDGGSRDETKNHYHCMKWLDSKPKQSVIYVAFGSQNSPSKKQTLELAKALEASDANFLWVFRPPSDFITSNNNNNNNNNAASKDSFLPRGFEDRITASDKGLLVENWASQVEILGHQSVGAFLSHCGWNSMMEALSNGVPMLTWPMGAEQPFNARFLEEEIGACVGVGNGVVCEVKCAEIVNKIKLVMNGDEGNVTRRKACEVKAMIQNATYDAEGLKGSSAKAMENFVKALLLTRKEIGSI